MVRSGALLSTDPGKTRYPCRVCHVGSPATAQVAVCSGDGGGGGVGAGVGAVAQSTKLFGVGGPRLAKRATRMIETWRRQGRRSGRRTKDKKLLKWCCSRILILQNLNCQRAPRWGADVREHTPPPFDCQQSLLSDLGTWRLLPCSGQATGVTPSPCCGAQSRRHRKCPNLSLRRGPVSACDAREDTGWWWSSLE